ncbi:hypothetical protein [Oxalicibacterium faecigallinarum]|uniref:Uncharacterized protein n=1 Tax=Oxalicibacterium faecigallinarum TaxID=573741 RepID=A0A8J3ANX5_9BURK|nr:hypothetical protein [Oxalicibacterium faecigallinarum]GGI17099.1 hypothetical protein GCM10008066_07270 [Oxalicibacterium faecigallinarum]
MRHEDRFFQPLLDANAPLILWGVYLFGIYAFSAVACDTALANREWGGLPAVSVMLVAISALVLVAALSMLWRTLLGLQRQPQGLLPFARLGIAILATLGIVWCAMPVFLMTSCIK